MSDAEHAGTAPSPHEEPDEALEAVAGTDDAENADSDEVGKVRKEAAATRRKLRESETRAESAEQQRDALSAVVLSTALRGSGVTPELFAAAGHELSEFMGDDGLDNMALTRASREVASKFGVRKSGHGPHTGRGGERPPEKVKGWDELLKRD